MAEPNTTPGKPTPDDPRKDAPIQDPPVHPEHDTDKPDKILYDENRVPG